MTLKEVPSGLGDSWAAQAIHPEPSLLHCQEGLPMAADQGDDEDSETLPNVKDENDDNNDDN